MARKKWTDEEIAFLLVKTQTTNLTIEQITLRLNSKFGSNRTVKAVQGKLRRLFDEQRTSWLNNEIDFIYSLKLNGFSNSRIIAAFQEQFEEHGSKLDSLDTLEDFFRTIKCPEYLQSFSKKPKQIKDSDIEEVVNESWENEPATRKQCRMITRLQNPEATTEEIKILTEALLGNIKKLDASNKIEKLLALEKKEKETKSNGRNVIKMETSEPKRKTKTHKGEPPYMVSFTDEQDLYLLTNFYDVSYDDLREYFQMPFFEIAKRFEMLVDSTEPKHISMLMEATEVVNQRKKEREELLTMGYWKRRKLKRQAKRIARLENKLDKIRRV